MPDPALVQTRKALHAVAELILASAQHHPSGTIRLRITPEGFATIGLPDLRVVGPELRAGDVLHPIVGTPRELGQATGFAARHPEGLYSGGSGVGLDDPLEVDAAATLTIANAFALGAQALQRFAPNETPVLWPEHFDVGIRVDEVNFGVSPGDDHLAEPYAYVGIEPVLDGPFWNAPFGAARPLTDFADASAVADFFAAGRDAARYV